MSRSAGTYSVSEDLGPFSNFIDVNGIKIVSLGNVGGQQGVEEEFTLKVAGTIQELLSNENASVDSDKQNELISFLSGNEVIQRVGVSSYGAYGTDLSSEPGWDKLMDSTLNTDFIWQRDDESGKTQATEVIEHLLHTITRFGLPGIYENEFDYSSSNSLISRAFEEAKKNGVYSAEEYSGGDQDDPDFQIMLKQEYLYCLIYANWGMIRSHVDGGSLDPEWSDSYLSRESISQGNPLGQQIFDKYISAVISKPDIGIINAQFKDFGGGAEAYAPDTIDGSGNNSSDASAIVNTYARDLVGDVLTGSSQFDHNSFDSKFYDLGEGRYGVQKKGESTIDEITGVSSLQFQDQALSLANDVAATFNQVKGIDDVSGVVFRLYNAAFARLPDAKGLENWINGNSSGGMTYATSAQEFSSSQEFKNRYGANTTDTQYITTLYNNVLERSPDKAGLANYQNLLANGKTRGALLLDFSESPENRGLFTEVTGLS